MPADRWYEWTGEKKHKQPWDIRLKANKPMFLAAITNWHPSVEYSEGAGFVIVTAAAEASQVAVHDRRSVILAPEDAKMWMNDEMPAEQAEDLACNYSLPPEGFEWYRVSTDVNSVKNTDAI